jgi:ParB-like chromosome segregation protein Spo0J
MGSLGSAIDETFLVDVRGLPDEALKANIEAFSRAINRLNANLLAQLEVLDRRGAVASEHGSTGAWLREKLNVSAMVAGRDVRLARDLADVLPETAGKLADGDISKEHCRVIASLRRDLKDEVVRAADPHLAAAATTHDPRGPAGTRGGRG